MRAPREGAVVQWLEVIHSVVPDDDIGDIARGKEDGAASTGIHLASSQERRSASRVGMCCQHGFHLSFVYKTK